jgi:hypothetical protein
MRKMGAAMCMFFFLGVVVSCAGTEGLPEEVQSILERKYLGKNIDSVFLDLGPVTNSQVLSDGNVLYSWTRQTEKYKTNRIIKSDERCVINVLANENRIVTKIGKVDDSLGAWRISYCREQFSL